LKIPFEEVIEVLQNLIRIPSPSRGEEITADFLYKYFKSKNLDPVRHLNNIYIKNKYFDSQKKNILLNSHLDTVKPNPEWNHDPYNPIIIDGKLYGLGSNDAGGSLVSLLATFIHFYDKKNLKYNIIFLMSAEEEISGKGGVESVLPELDSITFGIVGEPTEMKMAIAEKGLMVIDCISHGRSGHAAGEEGVNSIYLAIKDIERIRNFRFPKKSKLLGEVKMTVTMIKAGAQHNVIPESCHFVIDVRSTDSYTNEEILKNIRDHLSSEVNVRSIRLQPSFISKNHKLVKSACDIGLSLFGSSTLSDQALMSFPTVKIGPGNSKRSHTADEFIQVNEIKEAIEIYVKLLERLIL